MELKDRMKEMRKKKKWSQVDLSNRSGISTGMIGGIENGTRNPSQKTLSKLAETFGVSVEWLLTGEEKKDSIVQDFLQRLVDEGIVQDPELDNEMREVIIKTVEAELALLLKKKKN